MKQKLSYILRLRNALKSEFRNMPLFQNGSAIIVLNNEKKILLQKRTDRPLWCLPGGLQELGETFEEVAIRELNEETGLIAEEKDLIFLGVFSGEKRKNCYANGDIVYNNTVLYAVKNYSGQLNSGYSELVDNGFSFEFQKESSELKFYDLNNLPNNIMDKDLLDFYRTHNQNL